MVAQKVFFAHLYEDAGTLAKIDGALVFFGDNGTITTVEPPDCNFLVVLGEVGLANTQVLLDKMHGGAVGICLNRQQEVL